MFTYTRRTFAAIALVALYAPSAALAEDNDYHYWAAGSTVGNTAAQQHVYQQSEEYYYDNDAHYRPAQTARQPQPAYRMEGSYYRPRHQQETMRISAGSGSVYPHLYDY